MSAAEKEAPPKAATAWRAFVLGLAMLLGFAGTVIGLDRATERLGLGAGTTATRAGDTLRRKMRRVPPLPRPVPAVLFLGDSTVGVYRGAANVPERLDRLLRPEIGVADGTQAGSGYAVYYLAADLIRHARPDALVVNLNLGTFGRTFSEAFRPFRLGVASWLSSRRLLDAAWVPLGDVGITADALLFRVGVNRLGLRAAWGWVEDLQSRFVQLREQLDAAVTERMGSIPEQRWRAMTSLHNRIAVRLHPDHVEEPERLRREALWSVFGAPLTGLSPDDPNLARVTAFLCEMRDAGIPTLVYVNPTNVDQLYEVGASDPATLAASLALIRERVEACGTRFVDLHAIFRDEVFRDAIGHMRADEGFDAPQRIALELAPHVREMLRPSHHERQQRRKRR